MIPLVELMAHTSRLEAIYENWPVPEIGVQSSAFSSFDRTGGNDDGFRGTHSALYRDHRGEYVIFDSEGPGCLNSLWFTSNESGLAKLKLGKIRFYFDGEPNARITVEANELFKGKSASFPKSLVFDNKQSTGGYVSFVPIAFSESLRVTTEQKAAFYIATYDTFPHGSEISSGPVKTKKWPESKSKGLTHIPLKWTHTGTGVIERIVYKPSQSEPKDSWIRIWWDGDEQPAVSCPLDMFFGSGLGAAEIHSLAFGMEKGAWENRMPMPFWQSVRIELVGSGELAVQIGKQKFAEDDAGHLHATYNSETPTKSGSDFALLSTPGAGKLVATVLTVRPRKPADKGWWEGDTRTMVNGLRTPSYHGTGHEDDHFGGWSNEFLSGPFSLPMHGAPKVEMQDRNGQYNGNCTMYRIWHGVNFINGISHSVEHGHANEKNFDYASTAFWYSYPFLSARKTDELSVTDPASRSEHNVTVQNETEIDKLSSSFEGVLFGIPVAARTRSHLNRMTFDLTIGADSEGALLRRMYDQFHGRQRARVLIDGQFVGWWYSPCENKTLRWAESDFFIPRRFLEAKAKVVVTIDPPAGSPLWNASKYEIFSITKGKTTK
ncbi:MAG: DUF2961 domain-containing protein [Fimbriimonadales bacterium]